MQHAADGTPKIPLVLGGHGPRRTPALAAQYADDFNVGFSDLPTIQAQHDRGRAACEAIGRDPESLVYSTAHTVCCGSTPAELAARAGRIGRPVDDLRANALAGSPEELLDRLTAFAAAGVQRVYLQVMDLADLEHIALLGEHVLPAARQL